MAGQGNLAMRILLSALVVIVTASVCLAQQQERRRFGVPPLWGPVSTVRVERADISNQNGKLIEGPRKLLQTISYNEEGTRRELTIYRPDGAVSGKLIEIYDLDGRILETTSFRGNEDPGNRMVSAYDDKKRLIERVTYRPDGSVAGRITFVYRDNERTHKSVQYDQNGLIVSEVTGTLDLKTHRMQTISQNPTEVVQRDTAFTDIPGGQIFEERVNGIPSHRTVVRSLGTDGPEVTEYNPDGTVKSKSRANRVFDSHGNAVKAISSSINGGTGGFEPVSVMYWTIEYYGKE